MERFDDENLEEKVSVICGRNPVRELLRSGRSCVNKVFVSKTSQGQPIKDIIALAKANKVPIYFVPPEKLDAYDIDNNQGVLAFVSPEKYMELDELLVKLKDKQKPFIVILDEIKDPHNLGAITRNAVAFGADAIVLGKWRSCAITDTVVKVSAGASQLIDFARVSNIPETISKLKKEGYWVIGAEEGGNPLEKEKFGFPLAIVIGSEGEGLHRLIKERCDGLVSIPQTNKISSLNASCAAAIVLYEIFKQKAIPSGL
jgi:23S rRNA (guanosine2251-2'-O)-methyltransferase